jgi:hypothetical protein
VRQKLSVSDFAALLILVPFLFTAFLYLRFVPSQTLLQRFQRQRGSGMRKPGSQFIRLAELLEKLDRRLFSSPSCLRKTLVLIWISSLLGYSADVKIGVRRQESGLAAHAWIEMDGISLETSPQDDYYLLKK